MRSVIPQPLHDTPEKLMQQVGYVKHCIENGRLCFHSQLDDNVFPRFHALVSVNEYGMEIDLHIDQQHVWQKGNHDQKWAYTGSRVEEEIKRIVGALCGESCLKQVNHPTNIQLHTTSRPTIKKRGLFKTLFK